MAQDETVRCFVAVELPDNVKKVLSKTIITLRDSCKAPVKWVDGDAIHLTLKFLGNVPTSRIEDIRQTMAAACKGSGPLRLRLAALGAFPSTRNPRVVWIGLEGDHETLGRLAQSIDVAMVKLGFPAESRPFAPHLTLGRVRQEATTTQRESLSAALRHAAQVIPEPFDVSKVSLMKSLLSPEGARYTCLGRVGLRDMDK